MDLRRSRALRTLGSDDCSGYDSRRLIGNMMLIETNRAGGGTVAAAFGGGVLTGVTLAV